MKSALSVGTLVISVAALALSVYTRLNPPVWRRDFGTSDPGDLVRRLQSVSTDGVKFYAGQAFLAANRKQILRSLEIVEKSESGDYGIVFFRYKIDSDVFREAVWVGKVNKKWYVIPHLSEYSDRKPADEEWFEKMIEKKESWEKGSAARKF